MSPTAGRPDLVTCPYMDANSYRCEARFDIDCQPGDWNNYPNEARDETVGINLTAAADPEDKLVEAISREIATADNRVETQQPVEYLRIRYGQSGCPSPSLLTELVFRVCNHYRLHHARSIDRGIEVPPEECTPEQLALMQGLGFNRLILRLDMQHATAQTRPSQIESALGRISDYPEIGLQPMVLFNGRTDPAILNTIVSRVIQHGCGRIECHHIHGDASANAGQPSCQDAVICRRLRTQLEEAGFTGLGAGLFVKPGSLLWQHHLADNLRCYPWGIERRDITRWLALGPGAMGLKNGYFYRNRTDAIAYCNAVSAGRSPIEAWEYAASRARNCKFA